MYKFKWHFAYMNIKKKNPKIEKLTVHFFWIFSVLLELFEAVNLLMFSMDP
jgi:hypothetical protein